MDTKYDFGGDQDTQIVYIRPVDVDELPEEYREQAMGLKTIYAVHTADGERVALVRDRAMAFVLAKQHDMEPVTVH